MKKYLILLLILTGCGTTFTNLSQFDAPIKYAKPYDPDCTCIWEANYDNIISEEGFILLATKDKSSRLVTKNGFNFEPPFTIEVTARWTPASRALYCPAWAYPVEDFGGSLVEEFDVVEGTGKRVVMTAHLGKNGYGNHISYPHYEDIDPTQWHRYKMTVTERNVKWWVDGKKISDADINIGNRKFYLRISIGMYNRLKNDSLPEEAKMEIKKLKLRNYVFEENFSSPSFHPDVLLFDRILDLIY